MGELRFSGLHNIYLIIQIIFFKNVIWQHTLNWMIVPTHFKRKLIGNDGWHQLLKHCMGPNRGKIHTVKGRNISCCSAFILQYLIVLLHWITFLLTMWAESLEKHFPLIRKRHVWNMCEWKTAISSYKGTQLVALSQFFGKLMFIKNSMSTCQTVGSANKLCDTILGTDSIS